MFQSFKTWDIYFFGWPLVSRATDVFPTGDDHQESEEVFHFRGTNRDCSRVKPVLGDSFCDDEACLLKEHLPSCASKTNYQTCPFLGYP